MKTGITLADIFEHSLFEKWALQVKFELKHSIKLSSDAAHHLTNYGRRMREIIYVNDEFFLKDIKKHIPLLVDKTLNEPLVKRQAYEYILGRLIDTYLKHQAEEKKRLELKKAIEDSKEKFA